MPSLPTQFPLDHILHWLAPAVSDCMPKEGEFAKHNISQKMYGSVKLYKDTDS